MLDQPQIDSSKPYDPDTESTIASSSIKESVDKSKLNQEFELFMTEMKQMSKEDKNFN